MTPSAATTQPRMTLLTVSEVASRLRISRVTVYRLIDGRKIPFYKVGGSLRFAESDVEAYLQGGRVESIQ